MTIHKEGTWKSISLCGLQSIRIQFAKSDDEVTCKKCLDCLQSKEVKDRVKKFFKGRGKNASKQ